MSLARSTLVPSKFTGSSWRLVAPRRSPPSPQNATGKTCTAPFRARYCTTRKGTDHVASSDCHCGSGPGFSGLDGLYISVNISFDYNVIRRASGKVCVWGRVRTAWLSHFCPDRVLRHGARERCTTCAVPPETPPTFPLPFTLVVQQKNCNSQAGGNRSHHAQRSRRGCPVRQECYKSPGGVAKVPPKAERPNAGASSLWRCMVADGGGQGRVHQARTKPEDNAAQNQALESRGGAGAARDLRGQGRHQETPRVDDESKRQRPPSAAPVREGTCDKL